MTPPYQIALWSFVCGAILGWVACDLRWRAAARKLNQVVKELGRLVKSLPVPPPTGPPGRDREVPPTA